MKRLYIYGLTLCLGLSSCSDFLEKKPSTSLGTEDAITSVTDVRNAINGISYLMSRNRMTYSADFAIISDLKGSDFYPISQNNQAGPIGRYQITKNDDIPWYAYQYFYRALANVNSALSQIDAVPASSAAEQEELTDSKGQLFAWRAMLHFDLARMFCTIPVIAEDVNAANTGLVLSTEVYAPDYLAPRTTLKETYDQIFSDFEVALSMLSKDKNNGRINYWAALAMKSRAHLWNGDNADALEDAQEVIDNSGHKLYTIEEYPSVWGLTYTTESLFELTITTSYNAQRNSVGYYCDATGYGECGFVTGEGTLLDYLQKNPSDVRSQLVKDQTDPENNKFTNKGYFPAKYPGRENNLYVNSPKIIRLSEVYLIAAEAALKTTTSDKGAEYYINELRKNRIEDYEPVASVTIEDILFERRVELFAENGCAWDEWRNMKSVKNANVKEEINYTDYRTIFPIPQEEMNRAPGILVQNPNY